MPGRRLTTDKLEGAAATAILELVNTTDDLASAVDDPRGAEGDLVARLDRRRQQGTLTSIEQLGEVATGEDELENLLVAAYAGPLSGLYRRPDVPNRQVGLDLIVLDPATDRVHILNPSATAVWYHLTPDRSFRAIIDAIWVAFGDATGPRLVLDLAEYLGALIDNRLLLRSHEPVPEPGGELVDAIEIPDAQISSLARGYMAPAVISYSIDELEEGLATAEVSGFGPVAPFADTWGPTYAGSWASMPSFGVDLGLSSQLGKIEPQVGRIEPRFGHSRRLPGT